MGIIVVNLQDNRAVFRIFIALLRFSFDSPSYYPCHFILTCYCCYPTHALHNISDHSTVTGDGSDLLIHSTSICIIGYISVTPCGQGFMRIEQVTAAYSKFLAWFAPKPPLSDSSMTQQFPLPLLSSTTLNLTLHYISQCSHHTQCNLTVPQRVLFLYVLTALHPSWDDNTSLHTDNPELYLLNCCHLQTKHYFTYNQPTNQKPIAITGITADRNNG
jgi:hypothetical protein